MTDFHFFPAAVIAVFLSALLLYGQDEMPEGPSLLPPGMEVEGNETENPPAQTAVDDSIPPEKAKSAVASVESDAPHSLDLTSEQEEQLCQITKTLFQIPSSRTGAGQSEIVEIPLPLHDAMAQVPGSERIAAVDAYWRLRSLIAVLNVETIVNANTLQTFEHLNAAKIDTPEFQALIASWDAYLSTSAARIAETRIEIRKAQVELMQITRRSVELGWPIPSSLPWYGNYSLESESAQAQNFILASEAILIPEKIRTVFESGFALGPVDNLFKPEITSFERIDDGYLYLKTIENKRLAALSYIRVLESLNGSIARYVNAYSVSLDSKTFVNCLIGSDEE